MSYIICFMHGATNINISRQKRRHVASFRLHKHWRWIPVVYFTTHFRKVLSAQNKKRFHALGKNKTNKAIYLLQRTSFRKLVPSHQPVSSFLVPVSTLLNRGFCCTTLRLSFNKERYAFANGSPRWGPIFPRPHRWRGWILHPFHLFSSLKMVWFVGGFLCWGRKNWSIRDQQHSCCWKTRIHTLQPSSKSTRKLLTTQDVWLFISILLRVRNNVEQPSGQTQKNRKIHRNLSTPTVKSTNSLAKRIDMNCFNKPNHLAIRHSRSLLSFPSTHHGIIATILFQLGEKFWTWKLKASISLTTWWWKLHDWQAMNDGKMVLLLLLWLLLFVMEEIVSTNLAIQVFQLFDLHKKLQAKSTLQSGIHSNDIITWLWT